MDKFCCFRLEEIPDDGLGAGVGSLPIFKLKTVVSLGTGNGVRGLIPRFKLFGISEGSISAILKVEWCRVCAFPKALRRLGFSGGGLKRRGDARIPEIRFGFGDFSVSALVTRGRGLAAAPALAL